jgi:putative selenium metabolism protein SsnA
MLLRNCTLLTLAPPRVGRRDLRIEDGVITASAPAVPARRGEEVRDLGGAVVMPGMVCAHTHLYSSLSRGMPAPRRAPGNFTQILEYVWWRLDRALDEDMIYASALAGAVDAVRYGTTTLIDHHASPNAIPGSLDIIRTALADVGLRGVLCYETTDRGGARKRDAGLHENERFALRQAGDPMARGMIGAHASFTLSDATMERLAGAVRASGCGLHIHAAEDVSDVRRTPGGIIRRLDRFGLLTPRTILAHGVHLTAAECARVRRSGAWLVHNPRSNMNNAVGYAPIDRFGAHAALGTDGFPADMFEEAKIGFFRNRESARPAPFDRIPAMLAAGQALVSGIFERPFGTLEAGAPADIAVLDYRPPTPLTPANVLGHFLFGMHARMVTDVMVHGAWILRDRRMVRIDEERLARQTRRAAQRLWKAMEALGS